MSYDFELADCESECPGALRCKFADGRVETLVNGDLSTLFPGVAENDRPRYAQVLDGQTYSGTIDMFDTTCNIKMEFAPVGIPGLAFFSAVTQDCKIGDRLAPNMPSAAEVSQNPGMLRHKHTPFSTSISGAAAVPLVPPFRGEQGDVGQSEEIGKGGSYGGAGRRLLEVWYWGDTNGSHYDFTNGSSVDMTLCQNKNNNVTSRGCFPYPNNNVSRCIQYPLKDEVYNRFNKAVGPSWKDIAPVRYECRCDVGYFDEGCAEMGYTVSLKCGSNTSTLERWPTSMALYEEETCECGIYCNDIDECSSNLHNCHLEAHCTNAPGSFSCACNVGFHSLDPLPGILCVDINECVDQSHNCFLHATCANTHGSFTC
jgi:hypothetical protein